MQDLGAWWEEETGLPIPLGGILARRDLGAATIRAVDTAIRASLEHARAHPQAARAYIRAHAQELDEAVIDAHITLYVNDFSLDLGAEGVRAVETLLARAEARGLIPQCNVPLFMSKLGARHDLHQRRCMRRPCQQKGPPPSEVGPNFSVPLALRATGSGVRP